MQIKVKKITMNSVLDYRQKVCQFLSQLLSFVFLGKHIFSVFVPYKNVGYFEQAFLISKRIYLTSNKTPHIFKLLYVVFVYESFKLTVCNFLHMTKFSKIIWFDYFRFIGMPENFNLGFALLYYQFYYFYFVCYFQAYNNNSVVSLYRVLILKQVKSFFLSTKYKEKYNVIVLVKRCFLIIVNYQQVNVISFSK